MTTSAPRHLNFARRSFLPRMIGLALGFLMVASVLVQRGAPGWMWIGPALHCFAGPHVAWWLARRAADPREAERRNLLADHFFGGMWTALMAFNVLPAVLTLCLLCMNSMAGGGRALVLRGLLLHGAGIGLGLLVFGVQWEPASTMTTVLASLPVLVMQPIAISLTAHLAINKLQSKRAELEHQGRHDGLSGLFNRAHWESLVELEFDRCKRSAQPAALVLADLDHFKRVNDLHGHAAGDAAIRGFAHLLRQQLRRTDAPGRYGGEEFGMLLPDTTAGAAREVIERLRQRLHDKPLLEGAVVTASFGVAELTPDVESHTEWLRLADQMLYRAKHLGRDRIAVLGEAEGAPSVAPSPAGTSPHGDCAAALRDSALLPLLLSGLDLSDAPLALFDPSDRLALANPAFIRLYHVQPEARSFTDIFRHCHAHGMGPRVDSEGGIEAWLRKADAKRRSRPWRSFPVEMVDGRRFWALETSFRDGWVLLTMHQAHEPATVAQPVADA
jgi:diguanylate cyclase